jgi:hypothetical protein
LSFKRQFIVTQDAWKQKYGWLFFRPLSEDDEHCYSSLRIHPSAEQTELDTQVMYLAKLMVDSLNEREIAKNVEAVPNQKGIDKLAACLRKRGLPNYEEHIQFLRELQSLRSGAAHRKGHELLGFILPKAYCCVQLIRWPTCYNSAPRGASKWRTCLQS